MLMRRGTARIESSFSDVAICQGVYKGSIFPGILSGCETRGLAFELA